MKKIKTILIGTSEFAAIIFAKMLEVGPPTLEIIGVVTVPDKPVGRKQILTPSPVKIWAKKNKLAILQLEDIKNVDLIIVTAYGQIIPKKILDIPKFGAINIHPSLLPKYRGASPIQTTILNGDKKTGVTIMLMDEKMDHGDIISSFQFPIFNKPTYKELSNKLANVGAELLIKTLPDYLNGKIKPEPQDHSKATFCKLIKKEDGKIDWNDSAEQIERKIRAYHIWPTVYTNNLKILQAEVLNEDRNKKISEVFTENKELMIQTKKGILILKRVQPHGKKPMSGKDFLNGHSEIIGTNFQ